MSAVAGTRADRALLVSVERGEVGGVIIFASNVRTHAELQGLIHSLQRAARAGGNPPLLVAVDQEGGRVKRFPAGPPAASAAHMGRWHDPARVEREGEKTARYLARVGVNVDLAPVLDVPDSSASFLGARTFGRDPGLVARAGAAFAVGLQRGGVAATGKHFPGLGTARANTDQARVVVRSTRSDLEQRLFPFRTAIARGIRLVMVSNASYPAFDRTGKRALFSSAIVTELLRRRLGFRGVVITDSMEAPAPRANPNAPAEAIAAGVDILLYTSEPDGLRAAPALTGAVGAGRLPRSTLQASYTRIVALKRRLSG